MTHEEQLMDALMEQTYRVAQYGRRLSHGHLVSSPSVVELIATYRRLADLQERVLLDNGMDTSIDILQLPSRPTRQEGKA